MLERIGPFDPWLGAGAPFAAAEDTDYKLRLEAAGVVMLTTPRAVVQHTYGRRYGLRAVLRHARNYAVGNAGLAAKLTLLGDPRGSEWLRGVRRDALIGWLRARTPQRLPAHLVRCWRFSRTYHRCLRQYRTDPLSATLMPLAPSEG